MDSELVKKTNRAVELRQAIEKTKAELALLQDEFSPLSDEIVKILEALNIDSISAEGFMFFIEEKSSVKIPRSNEDKEKFFAYLKSIGVYDEIVSVNSQTLNSLFKSLSEQALENGVLDFQIPGIEEPKTYKSLRMRRTNKGD